MSSSPSKGLLRAALNFILKFFRSVGYALQGLKFLVSSQNNAKIHAVATLVAVAAAFLLKINSTEWCILLLCMGSVWSAEAFNTALEALTDLVSPEKHPLAGKAKDVAAAAVLLPAIVAAICGAIIFLPKIWQLLIQ